MNDDISSTTQDGEDRSLTLPDDLARRGAL